MNRQHWGLAMELYTPIGLFTFLVSLVVPLALCVFVWVGVVRQTRLTPGAALRYAVLIPVTIVSYPVYFLVCGGIISIPLEFGGSGSHSGSAFGFRLAGFIVLAILIDLLVAIAIRALLARVSVRNQAGAHAPEPQPPRRPLNRRPAFLAWVGGFVLSVILFILSTVVG